MYDCGCAGGGNGLRSGWRFAMGSPDGCYRLRASGVHRYTKSFDLDQTHRLGLSLEEGAPGRLRALRAQTRRQRARVHDPPRDTSGPAARQFAKRAVDAEVIAQRMEAIARHAAPLQRVEV